MGGRPHRHVAIAIVVALIGTSLPAGRVVPFLPTPAVAVAAVVTDDFNDDAIDADLWEGRVSGTGPSHSETNQRLQLHFPATSTDGPQGVFGAGYSARCLLGGDFDIQVDFALLTWPAMNGIRIALGTNAPGVSEWTLLRISRAINEPTPREIYLVGDESVTSGVTATTDTAGALRLTRVGTTYTAYRRSGQDWVAIHSGSGAGGEVAFGISAWGHDVVFADQEVLLAFDNFVINTGQLHCPLPGEQLLGTGSGLHANNPSRLEAEPVNTATGNYVTSSTDLALPGRGVGLAFTRTYNSLDPTVTTLGPGWRHSYDASLDIDADGSVRFTSEDGAQFLYRSDGADGFTTPAGVRSNLVQLPDGTYEVSRRDQVRYRFDAAGFLTALLDRNDNQLTFTYTSGLLTSITDTVGRTVALTYHPDGRLASLSGPPDRTVSYGYDPAGRLASVTDARGGIWEYGYDAANRLTTIVDPNDHTVVTNEYGSDGRISAQTDARGKRGTFAWNPATETSTYTDARGNDWTDNYESNVLQSSADPLGNTTTYDYDASFNITSLTDPRGNVTTFTYDANSNMLTRTAPAPLAYLETWTYTARNDVETYTDGRAHTTTYEYDAAGNLIRVTAPLNAVIEYGRDPGGTGLLVSQTDPRDKTTTFDYDAQANLTTTTSPLGNVTTMTYDPAGRMLTSVDPRGNVAGANPAEYTTTFTYDAADHLTSSTDPLGNVTSWTYDPAGNRASATDAATRTTTWSYDAANHLTGVTDALDGVTAYAYDDVGNLVTRTDANDHVTTYAYDVANRLTSTTDPADRVWSVTHDAAGNVATRTDANANTTTYAYDALNRLTTVTYDDPSTATATYAYDANSNRTSMTDGAGTEAYGFDDLNRLVSVNHAGDIFGYGYDPTGNLISRTYPGQTAQTWVYDNDGRLTSANGATYTYDPAANLLSAATPDGLTARWGYDRAGRLLEVAHTGAGATLSRFTYALDGVGNRTAMTTRQGTVTYRYDALHRLTEACWSDTTCPGGVPATPLPCMACIGGTVSRPSAGTNPPPGETYRTYSYDPVGNRLSEASDAGTTTYAYDAADRMTSVTPPGQAAIAYTYDANGNQLTGGGATYTYDLADRLQTATLGGTTETYTYAGDGTRLSASTGAQATKTTKYLWDRAFGLPQLAIERNGNDALLRSYRYGLDLLSQAAGNKTYWYHHDGLGSVVDITGSTGTSVSWSEYYPYGLLRQQGLAGGGTGAPAVQTFGFTGEQLDSVTGLYHLRARQYDPATGRFLTTDPVASEPTDPYVASYLYVQNMPTVAADPSGNCLQTFAAALAGPPGAVAGGGSFLVCLAIVALGGAAVAGSTTYVVQNPPDIDIGIGVAGADSSHDSVISLAQRERKKLAGLREALRDLLGRRGAEPEAWAKNHWERNARGIEQQIRDILRRHPQWRQPGDPRLVIPGFPSGDAK